MCGVWVGNDDNSPTNRMTGGSLPAMTWHQIMAYAHTGIELKNIPGVAPNPPPGSLPIPVASATATPPKDIAPRPPVLTRRGADILVRSSDYGRCNASVSDRRYTARTGARTIHAAARSTTPKPRPARGNLRGN